ncbi:hypothetical protein PR048_013202 [Dryococelus australis]|uniref:Uncharacterized protein n=1 Tax=Dryococelus australis TaxID=614101 RepID=A0ABQ9HT07_9NEOP|nr:hypothetical protein PR048_013202 [Dryococelus australis]
MLPQIQNEIIGLRGDVIRDDDTTDMRAVTYQEKKQRSIGVRFFDEEKMMVREEFLGFVDASDKDTTGDPLWQERMAVFRKFYEKSIRERCIFTVLVTN